MVDAIVLFMAAANIGKFFFFFFWREIYASIKSFPKESWVNIVVVKALVRSATGRRLTNRLPKLSLITLFPPLNNGILGLRMGPYAPTPKFFTISGDPGIVIYQILDMMRTFTFL